MWGQGRWGAGMATQCAQFEPVAWWWTRNQIGRELSEHYEVQELPLKLRSLVRKLDDSDWLFPSVSREDDVDLFGG
jgi:hypothetical protein